MSRSLFHLAFPVHDLAATKQFYVEGLGCTLGRESASAITLGLAGNQLTGHLEPDETPVQRGIYPRHFGLVFLEAAAAGRPSLAGLAGAIEVMGVHRRIMTGFSVGLGWAATACSPGPSPTPRPPRCRRTIWLMRSAGTPRSAANANRMVPVPAGPTPKVMSCFIAR